MWGSNSNIIFKVTSEAVLEFYIYFPVEHLSIYVFFVTNWQTDTRSTQNYSSEPHKKKYFLIFEINFGFKNFKHGSI